MKSWVLGLSAWIIQDGNYADFQRGQRAEFAVEFNIAEPRRVEPAALEAELVKDSDYRITGQVVFAAAEVWVVDCGILMYQEEAPPDGIALHDWVTGTAFLGVDPFMYLEQLHRIPGMPALVYSWQIERIRRQTAPFIEVAPRYFERDPSKSGYVEIATTDAWNDDEGSADYVLDCAILDDPPKRRSATATP